MDLDLTDIPEWLVLITMLIIGYLARQPIRRAAKCVSRAIVSCGRHLARIVRIAYLPPGGTLIEPQPDGSVWKVERIAPTPIGQQRDKKRGGLRR